jgi:hypothetical protein
VTISDATAGTTIYYTTNGTTPTTSSTKYSGAVTVSATETLEAIAVETGYTNSSVATAAYTINPVLPVPTFSVVAGTYTTSQSVTISDATAGTTIYYTINGTTPTTSSSVYSSAIAVSVTETLEAIAVETGYTNSSVATAAYTINPVLPVPTFSVVAGTYTTSQSVTISDATAGTTIYYTTSGTTPTTSSSVYSSAIAVSVTETLEAIAVKAGCTSSAVATAAYTISAPVTSYINYSTGGFTASALNLVNGSTVTGGLLQLTDGGTGEDRSAWFTSEVPVQTFTADFTFQQLNATADGMTFVIQGSGPGIWALGGGGGGLGYQGITNSVAVKFDLYNDAGEGIDSTGLYTNGAAPTMPAVNLSTTAINLHSGDVMHAHMVYDGTNLTMMLTDTVTNGTVTEVFPVNIPSIVGGNTAYVGFTGGTGATSATQNVLSWTYVSSAVQSAAAPTFSPAAGSYTPPQPVTISDATSGSTIYYTTNGTTPTTSSTQYTGAITVSATETLEAIAVEAGYNNSPVSTAAYTINTNALNGTDEDFTISASSTSATAAPGSAATYAFTVSPLSPAATFPTAVTLSANGLPTGATYSFSPATVAAGAGPTEVSLTVQLPQAASNNEPPAGVGGNLTPRIAPIALGLLLLPFAGSLRNAGKRLARAASALLILVAAMTVMAGVTGCGSTNSVIGPTQQAQAYTVTVIGTSGSLSKSVAFTLTVMQ